MCNNTYTNLFKKFYMGKLVYYGKGGGQHNGRVGVELC